MHTCHPYRRKPLQEPYSTNFRVKNQHRLPEPTAHSYHNCPPRSSLGGPQPLLKHTPNGGGREGGREGESATQVTTLLREGNILWGSSVNLSGVMFSHNTLNTPTCAEPAQGPARAVTHRTQLQQKAGPAHRINISSSVHKYIKHHAAAR